MKVGTICYATNSGLGILARSFYNHGIITDPLVVVHPTFPTRKEWYPECLHVPLAAMGMQRTLLENYCIGKDVMFFFETPFDWSLIQHCRNNGIKTVLMPMYECTPDRLPELPDLILCSDLLNYRTFKPYAELPIRCKVDHIGVPVSVPWTQRTKVETFVHNAGHGGLQGRNGTKEVIEAWKHVTCGAPLILRSQKPLPMEWGSPCGVEFEYGTQPHGDLFQEGDCFIFPERHCGLSLPLQEAYASGLLVMAGDRFPMNTWLPTKVGTLENRRRFEDGIDPDCVTSLDSYDKLAMGRSHFNPLIPVASTQQVRLLPRFREVEQSNYDPRTIAAKVDEWYGRDITAYSLQGKRWAEENSWGVLKPLYQRILEELVK